ncbi:MAG: HipA family kinase [Litorilinea sp.]
MIRTVTATRYVTPLREGGSLPAVVEADDGEMYVMKFVGSGQGPKALVAELVAGEIGRLLGLRVPEIVLIRLQPGFGRSEPDPEIKDLLQASVGLNLGLRYLPAAFAYNRMLKPEPDAALASAIVWFDAYVTNVDRTDRNVNMLIWQNRLWLIDHGAALYFHHDWNDYLKRSQTHFPMVRDHALLTYADQLPVADAAGRATLTAAALSTVLKMIPDRWLGNEPELPDSAAHRAAYLEYLLHRRDASAAFLEEAINARAKLV